MPGFDGTGPTGQGPFTGGGRGYCIIKLPDASSVGNLVGYAGYAGRPVSLPAGKAVLTPIGPNLPFAPRGYLRQFRGGRRFGRLPRYR